MCAPPPFVEPVAVRRIACRSRVKRLPHDPEANHSCPGALLRLAQNRKDAPSAMKLVHSDDRVNLRGAWRCAAGRLSGIEGPARPVHGRRHRGRRDNFSAAGFEGVLVWRRLGPRCVEPGRKMVHAHPG